MTPEEHTPNKNHLCVWFDSLHPSQQFFSHVGNGLLSTKQ